MDDLEFEKNNSQSDIQNNSQNDTNLDNVDNNEVEIESPESEKETVSIDKAKNEKKKKKKKIIIISIISIVIALPLILWIIFELWLGNLIGKIQYDTSSQPIDYNVSIEPEEEDPDFVYDPNSVKKPDVDIYKDTDVLNILLIGTDERSDEFNVNARSDSMMILSLNFKTNKIRLVSLARNIPIDVPEVALDRDKILTNAFRFGGADLVLHHVREYFRLDVDRYVRMNFYTFERLIDMVGGVDVELTIDEVMGLNGTHPLGTNARTKATVVEGENHLSGYDALQYSRLRYIDSDYYRIERQRNVVMNVIKNAKGMNFNELNAMLEAVAPLIKTNFTQAEIRSIVYRLPVFLTGVDIENMSVPNDYSIRDFSFVKYQKVLQDFIYG